MKDDSAKAFLGDLRDSLAGSHDTGDPTTTNVYLGNLSPQLTEQELMEMFGKYGPLVSDNDIDFKLRAILVFCMYPFSKEKLQSTCYVINSRQVSK